MMRTKYSVDAVMSALREIKSKTMTLGEAAKVYGVPKATLHNKLRGITNVVARKGPPPVLTRDEEAQIVDWVIDRADEVESLTQKDILDYVQNYLITNNRKNPFTNNRPGRSWIESFFRRNPSLSNISNLKILLKGKYKLKKKEEPLPEEEQSEFNFYYAFDDESDDSQIEGDDYEMSANIQEDFLSGDSDNHMESEEDSRAMASDTCESNDDLTTKRSVVLTDEEKTLMFDSENDDDLFCGYGDVKPDVLIDYEKLNCKQEELDSVEIKDLEDEWWKERPASALSLSSASVTSTSQTSSPSRLRTASSNPAFKLPFNYGFKREIVYRSTYEGGANKRRMADIYYYSPEGRKMRSVREIAEYLVERVDDIKLTTANFTFFKEPIGIKDPAKEIVREAKKKQDFLPLKKLLPAPKPETLVVKLPKIRSKKTPVQAVIPRVGEAEKSKPPRPVVIAKSSVPVPSRLPAQPIEEPVTKSVTPPCSISCASAAGLIPSLQCRVCVCLYHPVCVRLPATAAENLHGYVCPNCRQEKGDNSSKGPTEAQNRSSAPSDLPRLQRLPRQGEIISKHPGSSQPMPMLQRLMPVDSTMSTTGGKVLYSLGNWRPPIAPLQPVSTPQPRPPADQTPQQSLALMNGKKYVVIPRQTVNTASTSPEDEANKPPPPPPQPPMTIIGQPQLQLIGNQFVSSQPLLPKGSILVNQAGVPGAPGGMFLMTPADSQEGMAQPQLMFVNTAGPSTVPVAASMMAATPNSLAMLPKMSAESTANNMGVLPKKRPRLEGGYDFLARLSAHHEALRAVFRFLTVQELLRASRVCRAWRAVANDPSLWVSARLKNSRVTNWSDCIASLVSRGTHHLDLRKTLLPKREEEAQAVWQQFCSSLRQNSGSNWLYRLDLCRCPASVVSAVAESCPHLKILSATALTVKDDCLDMQSISTLQRLHGLRLKSFHGMSLENIQLLENLKHLKELSLTTVRVLEPKEVAAALSVTTSLELLELGDCTGLLTKASVVATALTGLSKLKRLRFEKLIMDSSSEKGSVAVLINGLSGLNSLVHMELINIEAGPGFDEAISALTSLKRLLLAPSYISHGAKTCQQVLKGVLQLKNLEQLTWIVTNEVIGVTKKLIRTKQSGIDESQDCIPVCSPLPVAITDESDIDSSKRFSILKLDQLDIVPLSNLSVILKEGLKDTRIIINKITFQGTWRQTISDWDLSNFA